ncbi:Gfo/Idh/MocA family oxidoreductase [uncultured Shewanella sp.]|uniref:Gfo/Idh/MocA family protein n=1 Tax=uncultured Shewanella sp. TaxID=173975 RepID=UPI00260F39BB|nr:Gfo/Idh/MocA family oxidoreductase [uncultured Shewanella sp.]
MRKRLNWGILGTSFISGVMADAIIEEGGSELYSVAGRSEAPLVAFAEKYEIEQVYRDYDALIKDDAVDIIYIALPNHLHHEFVVKAANAGKAIVCEKSLSIDMEKTREALAAVEKHGVFFAEGLMYLTHPLAVKVREVIRAGTIGDIRSIKGEYCAAISQFVNPESKGALYNLGCYPASLMHLVMQQAFGDTVFDSYHVSAFGRVGEDGNICESAATLQFSNGVICQLHTAEDYGLHAGFTVLGSKGSLVLASNPWLPESEGNRLVITEYEQHEETVTVSAEGNGFLYQVRLVLEAIEQGRNSLQRPAATAKDSHQIMQLLTDWKQRPE